MHIIFHKGQYLGVVVRYRDWASTQELSLVCRYFVQGGCSDIIFSFVAPPDDPAQKHAGFLIGLTMALFFLLLLLPFFFFLRHLKAKGGTSLSWVGNPGQTPQVLQIIEGNREEHCWGWERD